MLYTFITILPFSVCLFWTAVLLLDWRRDNAAQHVLTAFMLTAALLYLSHAIFFNKVEGLVGAADCVYAFCNIGVFPLYYLYIRRLTVADGNRRLVVLLPAVAICLWTIALRVFLPADAQAEAVRLLVVKVVFLLELLIVSWFGCRRLSAFDSAIANYYADTEGRTLKPTRRMMWVLLGGAFLSGVANFLGRGYFVDSPLLLCVPSLLFTILLFGVGYIGVRQEFCIDTLLRDEAADNGAIAESARVAATTDASGATLAAAKQPETPDSALLQRLAALMEEKQLYLQHDLRLTDVAVELRVGRTTLSQRINQEWQQSFSDYVNSLRIRHACRLLEQPHRPLLSEVAEQSGFSSDSSFYRAFRRHTGRTPGGGSRD